MRRLLRPFGPNNSPTLIAVALLLPAATSLLALAARHTPVAVAQSAAPEDLARFPQSELAIKSRGKTHLFKIWLADTPRRKQQGLMFVRSLASDRGMLFVHESPRTASMWMKNTYIPLDMLFIDVNGKIAEIRTDAVPHSLETIESRLPVLAVLELAGGEANRRGIRPGDRVIHPAFGTPPVRRAKTTPG